MMDINGGGGGYGSKGGGSRVASNLYRRVPSNLTESTKLGVLMSLLSILTMIVLFVCETYAFSHANITSNTVIDHSNSDSENHYLIRLNFNVTVFDVHCDFVSVDVWDTLGTNLQNVTKDVTKWNLDDRGRKQKFHGRNTQQRSLEHEKHGKTALQDIISNSNGDGELHHATDLTVDNLEEFYDNHPFAMVDYYAPWCVWCQRLAPTWEKFAANVARRQNDIVDLGVGKVDCVEHPQICKDERVMAFPTLRWHEGGKAVMPDYGGDRTAEALLEYAKRRAGRSPSSEGGDDDDDGAAEFDEEHHPGCQVSGHLMVNRVPGNLHVEAKSLHHEINSAMTNLTHRVNHLSFGTPNGPQGHHLNFLGIFDNDRGMLTETTALYSHANPMKDKSYPTFDFHQAYHHHLKIVSTHVDSAYHDATVVYQILEESQLVLYEVQEIPEIKFLWDMSPMSINLTNEGRRWYEYVTNLLAIIGGTYTTLGLINATLLRIFKPKRI